MYQWRKGISSWKIGKTLYISVPFTWLMKDAEFMASNYDGKVIIGGSGTMQPSFCEEVEPILFHNPLATFTTRGCPNGCKFCAVPKLEGGFKQLEVWRHAPVICDNNLIESTKTHFYKVIQSLKKYNYCDFNQGLEARKFSPTHARLISELKNPMVRFAFDHVNDETAVHDAIQLGKEHGLQHFGVYVLIGYDDTPEDAKYRLEKIREWGALPNPMRFQPLDAKKKDEYVHHNWTELQLRNMMRYYSRLNWHGFLPYEAYRDYPLPLFDEAL